MTENRLPDYLDHIRQAAADACSFIEGLRKEDFVADKRTQQAGSHPEIPWHSMRGMRDRIAHGYFDINLDLVWETVRTALPLLLDALAAIGEGAQGDTATGDGTAR